MYTKVTKAKKGRCGISRNFNEKWLWSTSPFEYVKVEIIEQVYSEDPSKIKEMVCYSKKYWQSQIFTVTHGMSSISDNRMNRN